MAETKRFRVTNETPAADTMPGIPPGVVRVDYISGVDGALDWALLELPKLGNIWIVFVHGALSKGDQLYVHAGLRDNWMPTLQATELGIISVNLRGDAFMCPAAVEDLHSLLQWLRTRHSATKYIFFSGSMGGMSNLVYATFYPEDCAALAALGASTDLAAHYNWALRTGSLPVSKKLAQATVDAYGGTPEQEPDLYRRHSSLFNAGQLTMPLYLSHGEKDALIPVAEMRALVAAVSHRRNVIYNEIKAGDHDSPVFDPRALEWLLDIAKTLRREEGT